MTALQRFSAALVLVCLGCGGKGGSDDAATATQTDTGATSTPETTSTANSTSTAAPTTDGTTDPTTAPTTDPTTGLATEPTTGGADKGLFCEETCKVDTDCQIGGDNFFHECKDGVCATTGCVTAADCVVSESLWNEECAAQADCTDATCIDIGGGVGRCAPTPADLMGCADFGYEEAMYPPIEGGEQVVVCAQLDYECRDGACFNPCETDDDCFLILMPRCDKATGMCVCTSDADCAPGFVFGVSVCLDGRCGCASDTDCAELDLDRCYEGTCGCSSTAACPPDKVFDGSTIVCQ